MKKIILFYKCLIEPGGAERLLIEEYKSLKKMGYSVTVISQKISDSEFFSDIRQEDTLILSENFFFAWYRALKYLSSNQDSIIISASGHIEIFLYTMFLPTNYFLKIHHPSFMSFNEYDKYSIFQIKHFKSMVKLNFGASRFIKIRQQLSFLNKLYINLRACISILAIKKAKQVFVLSEYAKREKEILFNVKSEVVKGALDKNAIGQKKFQLEKYKKSKNMILTIARLDENKRIDILIEAFNLVLLEIPDAIFVIGGKGEELNRLEEIVKINNLEDKVFLRALLKIQTYLNIILQQIFLFQ